jgi:type I restriction enzyme S subunit
MSSTVIASEARQSSWRECKLGDVAEINPTESIKKGVSAKKIPMDALQPFTKKIPRFELENYNGGVKFKNGDTLVARITPSLENGKTAFVDILDDNEVGFGSTEFIVLREKENQSDKHFLYYLAMSPEFREIAIKSMTGSSGRQRVQNEVVFGHEFLIPPLEEQKAIAEVLSSLDDKIDLLHRQNQTLESLAQTLFRQWFIEEAKEEWEEIKLGNYLTPKKGKNITKAQTINGIYPVVAGGLMPSCHHHEFNTKAPVITISASGANAGFVSLYNIPVWSSDSSYIDDSVTEFVYFFYVFLKHNQDILTDKQEGSAQPHIYSSHIADLNILKYPITLIKKFEQLAKDFFTKINYNQKQIQTLENLRDTLLPKLLNGEARVKI